GEPVAEASERRLRLVEDQQHVALARFLLQRVEIAVGRHDDAPGADHRLGDDGGTGTGRLHVVELEADLHARAVALVATVLHRTAIRVRLGDHVRARHAGSVALAVARKRYAARVAGDAV